MPPAPTATAAGSKPAEPPARVATARAHDDTQINRASFKLVYEQVAEAIAARITAGRYPIKLPSEFALAEEFGVSYATVRHATAILRKRGLIITTHGRGTYVAPGYRTA